jgi:uncharacterized phage protein (TIGR02220 family)
MAENKKSFILYCDLIHQVEGLTDDEAGKLLKHLLRYVNDQNPCAEDRLTAIVFEPIKQQLKRDLIKWEGKSDVRSETGRLGGIKSGETRRKQKEANEANEANASKTKQKEANEPVNVTVNDNVNDKYKSFIVWFNGVMDKKYKGDKLSQGQFNARLKENYTSDNFKNALSAIRADKFHKENNYKYITPEFLTRSAQLEKWSNFKVEVTPNYSQYDGIL